MGSRYDASARANEQEQRSSSAGRSAVSSSGAGPSLVQMQQLVGNQAMLRLIQQRMSENAAEARRFQELQRSTSYERDPNVSSMRNFLIDQYEQLVQHNPEDYTGNIYSQVLPSSTTEANYNAAAGYTARDPVNNRTRWALQSNLLQYGIEHGYEELAARAEGSTEFSYQIHVAAFDFANGVPAIGRLPWALLTHVNVPALGETIGDVIYMPQAMAAGIEAGLNQLALDPLNSEAANAAFNSAYAAVISQKYDVGGELINWTIETTNSPHGESALPWYGKVLRNGLDVISFMTYPLYD